MGRKYVPLLFRKHVPVWGRKYFPVLWRTYIRVLCRQFVPIMCRELLPVLWSKDVPLLCKNMSLSCTKTKYVLAFSENVHQNFDKEQKYQHCVEHMFKYSIVQKTCPSIVQKIRPSNLKKKYFDKNMFQNCT